MPATPCQARASSLTATCGQQAEVFSTAAKPTTAPNPTATTAGASEEGDRAPARCTCTGATAAAKAPTTRPQSRSTARA